MTAPCSYSAPPLTPVRLHLGIAEPPHAEHRAAVEAGCGGDDQFGIEALADEVAGAARADRDALREVDLRAGADDVELVDAACAHPDIHGVAIDRIEAVHLRGMEALPAPRHGGRLIFSRGGTGGEKPRREQDGRRAHEVSPFHTLNRGLAAAVPGTAPILICFSQLRCSRPASSA